MIKEIIDCVFCDKENKFVKFSSCLVCQYAGSKTSFTSPTVECNYQQ